MSLLVLAYPELKEQDYDWIQAYRKKYDELYHDVVAPHFTIVFPVFNFGEEDFVKEIKTQSLDLHKIEFEIKCATINKDSFQDVNHEFLVPDKGNSEIIKLHDKLYSGKLFSNLKLDIDFIPHIGIGNAREVLKCKKRVDELNKRRINIKGIISKLNIVCYKNDQINTICKIELN